MKDISSASTVGSSMEADTPTYEKQLKRANIIRGVDHFKFCFNFLNLIVTAVLATKDAKYYAFYNGILVSVIMTHRLYEFYTKRWHFYLFDFCYLVNTIVNVYIIFFPKSEIWFFASFALAIGPILNAVNYFRNSFVFHSTEKTTSLLIHCSPPLAMFLIHWHDESKYFVSSTIGIHEFGLEFLLKWFGSTLAFYGVWSVAYYILIFKLFKNHILKNKYETLYSLFLTDPRTAKHFKGTGENWIELIYMWRHFFGTFQVIAIAMVFYYSYWLALVWVIFNLSVGIYNGGTYLIEYHSARYERNLFKKHK